MITSHVRVSFDTDADAAYIYLTSGSAERGSRSEVCDIDLDQGAIIVGFDEEKRIVGIEVLGASRLLPPSLLES